MPDWTDQPLHFLDFEGNLRSGILEYGVVTLHHASVVQTATRLCRPRARVLADETAVHGLTDSDLAGAAPVSDDLEYFTHLRSGGPLAAHCAAVENSLLRSVWPYPRTCPDYSRPGEVVADWGPWVDSAVLCREFFPGVATVKLSELVSMFGLQPELDALAGRYCPQARAKYHAALYDSLAGALVLLQLGRLGKLDGLSIARMLVLSAQSGARRDELQQGSLF